MATRSYVPREDNEGNIGTVKKRWSGANFTTANINTINTDNILPKTSGAESTIGSENNKFNAIYANDVHIDNNLIVNGTTTTVNSDNLTVKDNVVEINSGETGTGVTKGTAGIEINRGTESSYLIQFDELDDMFKVGTEDNLETIASQDYVDDKVSDIVDGTTVAGKAAVLSTARTITLSGAVTGTATFDGSQDITITTAAVSVPTSDIGGNIWIS
jgi:hypothetical protein